MGRASLPYTAKDYESLRRELVARIPQLTERWTDFNPTDPGMVLLELFCGVADMLFFYLDAQTAEAFLPTVRQRQNLINLCKLVGYRLDSPVAASTELRFSLPAVLDGDITIPARAVCRARLSDGTSIDFETTTAATIPRGAVTASAPARPWPTPIGKGHGTAPNSFPGASIRPAPACSESSRAMTRFAPMPTPDTGPSRPPALMP